MTPVAQAPRLKKLLLAMTTKQQGSYYGYLGQLEKALEKQPQPIHRLFVAERILAEQAVSVAEATKL